MKRRVILVALLSSLASACAVVPADPYYGDSVLVAPPPPRTEYPGYPPYPDYVWISGYWSWAGRTHVWVPGRWSAPRPGYLWVTPRWVRDGHHWRMHEGHWSQGGQRRGEPPAPPPRPRDRDDRRGHDERRQGEYRPDYRPDYRPGLGGEEQRPARPPESRQERWSPAQGDREMRREQRGPDDRRESGRSRGERMPELGR